MKTQKILLLFIVLVFLTSCDTPEWGHFPSEQSATATIAQIPKVVIPTATATIPAPSPLPATEVVNNNTQTSTPTLAPDAWKNMPIVPVVSARMLAVFRAGLTAGRDPSRFSKIGDCQNITTYFLASFDSPKQYRLGTKYGYLQPTIDHFSGSWSRQSLAVRGGENVAAAMDPLWADPKKCSPGETPIACEIRVNNPSIVTISMEESWSGDLVKYNEYLRKIVEFVLSQNVVPILATRAEVPGSKNSINEVVARIAYDYQVPLWNFGVSVLPLPSYGLTADGFHLSQAANFFDDPNIMKAGWPWRNLTALEAIDAVFRAVSEQH